MSKINEHNNTISNTNSNRYTSNSNPHLPSQYAASSISITDKINYILSKISKEVQKIKGKVKGGGK